MLKLNSRGEDVRTLQENLVQLGYRPGPADGIFGENTEDGEIRFQETEGLYADGIVGPSTQEAMEEAIAETQDKKMTGNEGRRVCAEGSRRPLYG